MLAKCPGREGYGAGLLLICASCGDIRHPLGSLRASAWCRDGGSILARSRARGHWRYREAFKFVYRARTRSTTESDLSLNFGCHRIATVSAGKGMEIDVPSFRAAVKSRRTWLDVRRTSASAAISWIASRLESAPRVIWSCMGRVELAKPRCWAGSRLRLVSETSMWFPWRRQTSRRTRSLSPGFRGTRSGLIGLSRFRGAAWGGRLAKALRTN